METNQLLQQLGIRGGASVLSTPRVIFGRDGIAYL